MSEIMSMPSCEVRAAVRRWWANRASDPLLRAVAAGLATLCNLQGGKELKKPITGIDLAPSLMSPEERLRRLSERERITELERKAKAGEINPDTIKGGPVLLTGSMIGGR